MTSDRPRAPATTSGRWPALLLAILVNIVFIGVLFFSIRWQNRQAAPVMAELYAPPAKMTVAEPAATAATAAGARARTAAAAGREAGACSAAKARAESGAARYARRRYCTQGKG